MNMFFNESWNEHNNESWIELTLSANGSGHECDNLNWNEYDNEFGTNLIFDNEGWNCIQ